MPWNQRALEKNGPLVSKKLMERNGWLNKDTLEIFCKENICRNDPIWRSSFFNSVAQPPTSGESKRWMMDGRCKWCEWNILSDLSFAFQDFWWLIHKLHNFLDLQKVHKFPLTPFPRFCSDMRRVDWTARSQSVAWVFSRFLWLKVAELKMCFNLARITFFAILFAYPSFDFTIF